jgi:hypothetical protein
MKRTRLMSRWFLARLQERTQRATELSPEHEGEPATAMLACRELGIARMVATQVWLAVRCLP